MFRTIYFRCEWWKCYAYITSIASKARVSAFIGEASCIDRAIEGFSSKWARFVIIDGEKVEPDFIIVINFKFKFKRHDSQHAWKIHNWSIILLHSSLTFDYGQKEDKKFDDANNSIYSQHFSPEYAFILENADSLEAQFKRQPAHLERLYGTFFIKPTS